MNILKISGPVKIQQLYIHVDLPVKLHRGEMLNRYTATFLTTSVWHSVKQTARVNFTFC